MKFLALACLAFIVVAFASSFVEAGRGSQPRIPDHCNPAKNDFQKQNAAQLNAISANPTTDLWYQSIAITMVAPPTGSLTEVARQSYWQSRVYSTRNCAIVEVQAWPRSENQVVFQEIHSIVDDMDGESSGRRHGGGGGNSPSFVDQTYTVEWKTNYTSDSALVEGMPSKSYVTGNSIVQIEFFDPTKTSSFYTQQMQVQVAHQSRHYTQIITVDPTGASAPLTVWANSTVVPRAAQPSLIKDAFDAYKSGNVPVEQDPFDPTRYVYVYTGASAQKTSDSVEDLYYVVDTTGTFAQYFGKPMTFAQ
ncbi:MAG: hypothetical protein BVN35_14430 [Proteobacteria bacterium ST_bin11]|nr:MAG: hypothetical protein BVN35_14430 [Proteobacteria bacterium ST_bin11]